VCVCVYVDSKLLSSTAPSCDKTDLLWRNFL